MPGLANLQLPEFPSQGTEPRAQQPWRVPNLRGLWQLLNISTAAEQVERTTGRPGHPAPSECGRAGLLAAVGKLHSVGQEQGLLCPDGHSPHLPRGQGGAGGSQGHLARRDWAQFAVDHIKTEMDEMSARARKQEPPNGSFSCCLTQCMQIPSPSEPQSRDWILLSSAMSSKSP